MKRSACLILLFKVLPLGSVHSQAETQEQKNKRLEQEVINVENARYDAFKKGDAAALDRILDDDFTYLNVNGETHTRAELIADVRPGNLKYIAMKHSDTRVRIYENTAILIGQSPSTYMSGGKVGGGTARGFMNVYFKKNGQWRLAGRQETAIPVK